ncbi:MAG: DUF2730 family protein [Pseudomonadota bacterium]
MPDWDYKALAFFLSVANTLGILLTVIYAHVVNRQKANADSIEIIKKDHHALVTRLAKSEKSIEHLPSHDDLSKINRRISEVAQGVTKIEGTMAQIDNSVQLIHNHLLSK